MQLSIAGDAVNAGIFTYLVVDAGRTQIAPGSRTVLAIGPAPKSQVNFLAQDSRIYNAMPSRRTC